MRPRATALPLTMSMIGRCTGVGQDGGAGMCLRGTQAQTRRRCRCDADAAGQPETEGRFWIPGAGLL